MVYIAGSFGERARLRDARRMLMSRGYIVRASWLDTPERGDDIWGPHAAQDATRDLQEVREAQIVIVDTLVRSSTGGSDAELGYALAHMKDIWIVGPLRNGYHHLTCAHYKDWPNLIARLGDHTCTS